MAMSVPWPLLGLHATQTSCARLLGFAVPVLCVTLEGDLSSTLHVAALSTSTGVVKLLALPFLGGIVDRVPLRGIGRVAAVGQLAGACACLAFLLAPRGQGEGGVTSRAVAMTAVALLTAVAELSKEFASMGLELRVAPALRAEGLPQLNSAVKRIELGAKFLAPLAFGVLASRFSGGSQPGALAVVTGMVLVLGACAVEGLWRQMPFHAMNEIGHAGSGAASGGPGWLGTRELCRLLRWHGPVLGMLFSFALLFCTVLDDHDPVATAYLASQGVQMDALGACRSAGALAGMIGTWLWPWLHRRLGLLPGAATALWTFVLVLTPVAPLLPRSPYWMLLLVTLSRPFLWSFDLANVSVLQELVPPAQRGAWAGAQAVVCQLMELAISALAVAWSSADSFPALAAASFVSVLSAGILFTVCSLVHQSSSFGDIPVYEYPFLTSKGSAAKHDE